MNSLNDSGRTVADGKAVARFGRDACQYRLRRIRRAILRETLALIPALYLGLPLGIAAGIFRCF